MQPIERNGLISLLFLICAGTAFFLSDSASDKQPAGQPASAGKLGQAAPQRGSPQLDGLPAVAHAPAQRPQRSDLPRSAGSQRPAPSPAGPAAPADAGASSPTPPSGAPRPAGRTDLGASGAQPGAEERLVAGQPSQFTPLGSSAPSGPVLVGGAGRLPEGSTAAEIPRLGGLQATPPGSAPGAQASNAGPAPLATYTVQKGDTLSEISQKLLSSAKRSKLILAVNPGLDPDRLQAGQVIKLPSNEMLLAEAAAQKQAGGASGAPTAAALAANQTPAPAANGAQGPAPAAGTSAGRPSGSSAPAAAAENRAPVHVVAAGDNLWSIAERRLGDGNRYREIEALNPQVRGRPLSVGQQLRLPEGSAPVARANPSGGETPAPRSPSKPAAKPTRRVR